MLNPDGSRASLRSVARQVVLSLIPLMALVASLVHRLLWRLGCFRLVARWRGRRLVRGESGAGDDDRGRSGAARSGLDTLPWRRTLAPMLLVAYVAMPTCVGTIYSYWSYDLLDVEVRAPQPCDQRGALHRAGSCASPRASPRGRVRR